MISNLQLEAFRLQDVLVRFNESWLQLEPEEQGDERYDVTPDFDIYEHADGAQLLVRLSVDCVGVEVDATPRFRQVSIVVWGRFICSDDVSDEVRASLEQYNTVAILHGIARGMLVQVTGGAVGGPFLLPSLNYKAIVERKTAEAEGPGKDGDQQDQERDFTDDT
ncbi:MAG: hypothetical protein ACOX9R_10665 [Armatimonadota bacterium]|jgi:preprotein translocase subunit SecB